jgi:hypothetical protein
MEKITIDQKIDLLKIAMNLAGHNSCSVGGATGISEVIVIYDQLLKKLK